MSGRHSEYKTSLLNQWALAPVSTLRGIVWREVLWEFHEARKTNQRPVKVI